MEGAEGGTERERERKRDDIQEVPLINLEEQACDENECMKLLGAKRQSQVSPRIAAAHSDDALKQQQDACAWRVISLEQGGLLRSKAQRARCFSQRGTRGTDDRAGRQGMARLCTAACWHPPQPTTVRVSCSPYARKTSAANETQNRESWEKKKMMTSRMPPTWSV
jgi:hypothetical protein